MTIITADSILVTADAINVTADGLLQEVIALLGSTGGIPKAKKTHIKKSEHEDIAAIVKREFDILDGTYQPEVIKQVKQVIIPKIQQIQEVDYTEYAIALAQVNELLLQAKIRAAEYQAELDDEEAILMLL